MAKPQELIILPLQPKRFRARVPVLHVEPWSDPGRCPYCQRKFSLALGCRKVCACGYMEGCED